MPVNRDAAAIRLGNELLHAGNLDATPTENEVIAFAADALAHYDADGPFHLARSKSRRTSGYTC